MEEIKRSLLFLAITTLLFKHSWGIQVPNLYPLLNQDRASPYGQNDEGPIAQFPQVQISNGIIQGRTVWSGNVKRVNAFVGIPFAQPPVGPLRFKRPVAYNASFDKPFDATILPNACPQRTVKLFPNFTGEDTWLPNTELSEDCLYLNVWVPPTSSQLKRNVIFWIHGGGYFSGSSSLDIYNGGTLAVETNSIVVSTQYRLGPLGFLYLGTEDAPGNQGLLDQNMAMQWVHTNIEAFGGNPDEVTLMGESAGAYSVSFHLLSPMSQNLFRRAVLESGAAIAPPAFDPSEEALKNAFAIAEKGGCPGPFNPISAFDCLSQLNHSTLTSLQFGFGDTPIDLAMRPTLDNFFLTKTPEALLEEGNIPKKDILIGNNLNEGAYFLPYHFPAIFSPFQQSSISSELLASLLEVYFPNFNEAQKAAILFQYQNHPDPQNGEKNVKLLSDAVGDAFFVCPSKAFANRWAVGGASVYYYYFTQGTLSDPWPKWMGAKHTDEIAYFFGVPLNSSSAFTVKEQLLSRAMITLLGNFAKTGVPSTADWKAYTVFNQVYVELNADKLSTKSTNSFGPRAEQCAFWNDLIPKLVGEDAFLTESTK